jgi:hypothetical protein
MNYKYINPQITIFVLIKFFEYNPFGKPSGQSDIMHRRFTSKVQGI